MQSIRAAAADGRLVAFVGAGVSTIPPTSLPSWWSLNEQVVLALARQVAPLIGAERSTGLAKAVAARQQARRFPPEYQAELLASEFGARYFHVLQCLDSERPNAVHMRLARLGAAGHLSAIVTTNFDRAIEAAFHTVDAKLRTCTKAAEFEALVPELERGRGRVGDCILLKLHGSADKPDSLIDTLAQRKRGLGPGAIGCLRILLDTSHWMFLGWSGDDLEANDSYLGLWAAAERARGFTWLYRTKEEPRPTVVKIGKAYGDKAAIEHGELPDWLDEATASLLPVEPAVPDDVDRDERRRQAQEKTVAHASQWAEEIGTTRSALGLAYVLVAVGEPRAAIDLLRSGLEALSEAERNDVVGAVLASALAGRLSDAGENEEALHRYARALKVLKSRGDVDRIAQVRLNAGLIYRGRGRLPAARRAFERALAAAKRSGNKDRAGVAMHNLALVHQDLGEFDQGELLFRQEIEILRELGDEPNEGIARNDLGNLLAEVSRFDDATKELDQAIWIRERLGTDRGAALSLGNLARVHSGRGDIESAERIYRKVIGLFERLGDEPNRLTTLANLGVARVRQGHPGEALSYLREAVDGAKALKLRIDLARFLMNLGEALHESGDCLGACEVLAESAEMSRHLGTGPARAEALTELGISLGKMSLLDDAEKALREALDIRVPLKPCVELARVQLSLGFVDVLRGRLDEAAEFYSKARDLANHFKQLPLAAQARAGLASALGMRGKLAEALAAFKDAEAHAGRSSELVDLAKRLEVLAKLYRANGHDQPAATFDAEAARLSVATASKLGS